MFTFNTLILTHEKSNICLDTRTLTITFTFQANLFCPRDIFCMFKFFGSLTTACKCKINFGEVIW